MNQGYENDAFALRRFQALIEHSSDCIAVIDSNNTILYLSPSVQATEGYAPEEMIGKSGIENTHPEDLPYVAQVVEELLAKPGVPVPVLWRRKHKDGRWLWLEGVATNLLNDPAVNGIVTNYRDVTERREAEQTLKQKEEHLRSTFDHMMEGCQILDFQWRYVYINDTGVLHARKSREELIGNRMMDVYPGIEQTDVFELMARCMETRIPAQMENLFIYPDGSERWFDLRMQPSADGLFVLSIDITERKLAEQARESLEAQLNESQKMEALGTLAGGIAHDFNNILSAIIGNVDLAKSEVGADSPAIDSLNEIDRAASRARDLIQQILSFTRRQPKTLRVVEVCSLVEEAIRLLRATLSTRVSIDYQCENNTPPIIADSTQIQQVLLNLGTNAAYALQSKPGRINATVDVVTFGAEDTLPSNDLQEGSYARITISDTGCGMDEATLQRIFEPFFTTKLSGEGTGLGLAVVHGIVKAHGGAITVHSELNVGTTFVLYFPGVSAPVEKAPAETNTEPAVGKGENIVHIDDDEALVFMTKRLLEKRGFKVHSFVRQEDALEAIQENADAHDLVVTDYNMFGMSGLEVAEAVKKIREDLPVVIASGYITEELREKATELGVREFIYKPTTVEDYCTVIRRMLYPADNSNNKP